MSFNVVVAALAGVLCVLCVHRTVAMHTFPATAVEGDTRTCADAHGPGSKRCVFPGHCKPPTAQYQAIATGPAPGLQWNLNGGFCGAFSVQQGALSAGAWVSQDKVRKANRASSGPHNMHGDTTVGFEVMPSNVKFTADHLRLLSDEFDYTQPSPQAAAWKTWAKSHLVKRHPLVFFPMCKGDPHQCYPGSCPNGGSCDHVESMYGIYSSHALDDATVYDDDIVVHTSNQDCFPYYRTMKSLEDSTKMNGNCKFAGAGFGKNEMYPCIDESVTYGLAVTGLAVNGTAGKTSMTVDVQYEPSVRTGDAPMAVHANVTVTGLMPNQKYTILRFVGTENLPSGPPFSAPNATQAITAGPDGKATWTGATPFMSDEAVYHFTVAAISTQ